MMNQSEALIPKILEWPEPADWMDVAPGAGFPDVWDWHRLRSHDLKVALLERLRAEPDVEVTNELAGTTQAIVCATSAAWRRLLDRRSPVIPLGLVRVHDDEEGTGPSPWAPTSL